MRRNLLICIFLMMGSSLFGQKDLAAFIPDGYDTLYAGVARGDLNKDGIEDVVMVLGGEWEKEDDWMEKQAEDTSLPQRKLYILLGEKNGYKHVATGGGIIMTKDSGGAMGDPFAAIEIKNGVLIVYHYGGSSRRWSYTHKFRYQQNDFFLIGKTYESFWSVKECEKLKTNAGTYLKDENLITGAYEEKEITDECELRVNKKGKQEIKPLVSLSKFQLE